MRDDYFGGSQFGNVRKSRWETDYKFFHSFSQYDLKSGKFISRHEKKGGGNCGGIPIGKNFVTGNVCIDSSDAHSLIIGSTGSRKSRLVIMPTVKILGDAGESMIISDPKAEIYNRLSVHLYQNNYKLYVINLREPGTGDTWNPLALPYYFYRNGNIDKACEFVNDIAINLMLAEKDHGDPFWDYSARDLFFGLTLLLFKYCQNQKRSEEDITLSNLLRLRREMFSEENKVSNSMLWKFAKDDEVIASSLIGTVMAPNKTQSSILSTFDEKMRIFVIQPSLVDMLATNNISFDEIGFRKSAVFLIMPDEKTSYHRLISIFIKQSYEYLIFKAQSVKDKMMKVRINYVLDEFSSLPAIKDFSSMISASRSRNIRFHLVIQSKNQLVGRYMEESNTIFSNCMNWIFLTSREIGLLSDLSTLCGEKAHNKEPLMSVASLQHLDKEKGEALVLSGRLYPYISLLPDIDSYISSDEDCIKIQSRNHRSVLHLKFNFDEYGNSKQNNRGENFDTNQKSENTKDGLVQIQKELEAKFDELFGTIDENN